MKNATYILLCLLYTHSLWAGDAKEVDDLISSSTRELRKSKRALSKADVAVKLRSPEHAQFFIQKTDEKIERALRALNNLREQLRQQLREQSESRSVDDRNPIQRAPILDSE